MDSTTQLILANAPRGENWEDRERASDDVDLLLEEFEKRLPPIGSDQARSRVNGEAGVRTKAREQVAATA